ncbi:MAG: NAD(P)-dependent dehydrogenase (short-subunit alcohol dehydrogenase family) [Maribacter sp.]|jgi:NAD(P)-dependent dehydrogenase (short-subunit alcohol dehydrogenase family)
MSKWNNNNIPDQTGKIIIITGATSGLGKEATKVLAGKNARVVMAVRNTQKAEVVVQEIKKIFPTATIDIEKLDLNSLESVKTFSDKVKASYNRLDILINNAGVMACPFSKTKDGFEIQMGVNHLGHFALTGHLMPLLKKTKASRIVATASIAHRQGNINFDDINWEKRDYKTGKAYGDSKLANLYFAYELARKLKNDSNAPMVVTSHPGWTKTELDRHSGVIAFIGNIIAQTVEMGTLPTLRAAIDENAQSGDYFGPANLFEMRGHPIVVKSNELSYDEANAKRLWDISEELTGIRY